MDVYKNLISDSENFVNVKIAWHDIFQNVNFHCQGLLMYFIVILYKICWSMHKGISQKIVATCSTFDCYVFHFSESESGEDDD